jgi:hypothetical protein
MQDVSRMFGSLRSAEPWEASGGFYAGVIARASDQKTSAGLGAFFGLDLMFVRRLAFVCLLTLAVLGSYLITREAGYPGPGGSPEALMAQQSLPAFDSAPGQDNMLVTLTAYDH